MIYKYGIGQLLAARSRAAFIFPEIRNPILDKTPGLRRNCPYLFHSLPGYFSYRDRTAPPYLSLAALEHIIPGKGAHGS